MDFLKQASNKLVTYARQSTIAQWLLHCIDRKRFPNPHIHGQPGTDAWSSDEGAFQVVVPADGSSISCYTFSSAGSGTSEFNQAINPGDGVYGYAKA